ncbi:hypothetical protein EJB05_09331, partial [Eragrostis curvula]
MRSEETEDLPQPAGDHRMAAAWTHRVVEIGMRDVATSSSPAVRAPAALAFVDRELLPAVHLMESLTQQLKMVQRKKEGEMEKATVEDKGEINFNFSGRQFGSCCAYILKSVVLLPSIFTAEMFSFLTCLTLNRQIDDVCVRQKDLLVNQQQADWVRRLSQFGINPNKFGVVAKCFMAEMASFNSCLILDKQKDEK